jgi:hypothetical protein
MPEGQSVTAPERSQDNISAIINPVADSSFHSNVTAIESSVSPEVTSQVPSGSYPRIANVWWGEFLDMASPSEADQVQLFLGPSFTPTVALAVQSAAPQTPILNTINAIEVPTVVPAVPSSYYLLDTNGNKICDWPGSYLANLTNPAVVQYMAQYAQQQLTAGGITYSGIFFDNVETTISYMTTDCNGNPIQISAAGNGVATNPVLLDQEWSAGMYSLLATFKQLAPNAYLNGHICTLPAEPRALSVLNGALVGFDAEDIREGSMAFGNLWDTYQQWFTSGQQPEITGIQTSPPNQIAYGYGYTPFQSMVPSTVTFAQSYYPSMRFGLALSLMNNGYSVFDFGDTTSPVAWWYDEYNFNLGTPVTSATLLGAPSGSNQIINGGFTGSASPWLFSASDGGAATLALDTTTYAGGSTSSAHVNVTTPASANWAIDLEEDNLPVTSGAEYQVQFWAKADSNIQITVGVQGGAPSYANYGLSTSVSLTTGWNLYSLSFLSTATASDGRLEFWLGNSQANIWIDSVEFTEAPTRIYRRDFTNGIVLLNGTETTQTITVGSGFQHFTGTQAPLYQYIVDDADAGFSATGTWAVDTFDTGWRKATGPYYHAWKSTLHENDNGTGVAQWNLNLPADGQYTIQVWLPAAPASGTWTTNAVYKVMSGTTVLATATLNQRNASAGDQWFTIANVNLTAAGAPFVQLTNGGSGPLIADAIYVYSTTARYNNGAITSTVTLGPMDGILLQRASSDQPQTITFAAPALQATGETPLALSATASSGLAVTFTSNTPSICSVSGGTASMLSVGTCSITASQAGNASYSPAPSVTQTFTVEMNLLADGGFANSSIAPWVLLINHDGVAAATAALDSTTAVSGTDSARITITAAGTANWHIDFEEANQSMVGGVTYYLQFWAKADSARSVPVVMQGGAPSYAIYGLNTSVSIGTAWKEYTLAFVAPTTATDGRLQFYLGSNTGNVWFDDMQLFGSGTGAQSINFASPGSQSIAASPLALVAAATSGLAVSFASSTPAVCTVSGSAASLLTTGTCTITASQGGNSAYTAALPVTQSFLVCPNLIVNGGFESGTLSPWTLLLNKDGVVAGTLTLDSTTAAQGTTSAHIAITSAGTANWHADLEQSSLSLVAGATYAVRFWAKADSARSFPIVLQGGAPNYAIYGLDANVSIGTTWQLYTVTFVAPTTASDGRLQFYLGSNTGNVWLDNIQLFNTAN